MRATERRGHGVLRAQQPSVRTERVLPGLPRALLRPAAALRFSAQPAQGLLRSVLSGEQLYIEIS